jgi:hypothetical protein
MVAPYITHNTIVAQNNPKGKFEDIIVSGTPKPGVVMQVKSATEPVGDMFTWEVFSASDGVRKGPIAVLCEDRVQGKGITDAYVSGNRGILYFPVQGEFLLMQLQDVSGTGDTHAIGEQLIVDSGTGQLLATTGSPEIEPFIVMETIAAPTADYWALVMFTGN